MEEEKNIPEQENQEDKLEKIAGLGVSNPAKAFYWVLLIAITTLSSIVIFMYKNSENLKDASLTKCDTENIRLTDSLNSCINGRASDTRNFLEEANKKLEKRIEEQEKINNK